MNPDIQSTDMCVLPGTHHHHRQATNHPHSHQASCHNLNNQDASTGGSSASSIYHNQHHRFPDAIPSMYPPSQLSPGSYYLNVTGQATSMNPGILNRYHISDLNPSCAVAAHAMSSYAFYNNNNISNTEAINGPTPRTSTVLGSTTRYNLMYNGDQPSQSSCYIDYCKQFSVPSMVDAEPGGLYHYDPREDDEPPRKMICLDGFSLTRMPSSTKQEKISPEPHYTGMTGSDYFCSVPGRLSLLSSTCKYKVSVSEIHRRISQPECLNASLLGGILRRAKSRNGGRHLRERLESIGVRLPAGRRKAATVTVLTAMVEGEAIQLATDFDAICRNDFPAKECSNYLRKRRFSEIDQCSSSQIDQYISRVEIARDLAKEFLDLLNADRSPTTDKTEQPVLEESIQCPLTRFSMVTHGFGIPAIASAMSVYIAYLNELHANLKDTNEDDENDLDSATPPLNEAE